MTNPEINGIYYIHTRSDYEYCGTRYHAGVLNLCRVVEKVGDLYRVSVNGERGEHRLISEQSLMPISSGSYEIKKKRTW